MPEEKLLRLIRKEKKENLDDKKRSDQAASAAKLSAYFFAGGLASFFSLKKIIWLVFISACIYLAVTLIYPFFGFKEEILPEVEEAHESKNTPLEESRPYEFYLKGIKERQIFTSPPVQEVVKPQSVISADQVKDLVKDIILIGVIAGEQPQAIIEDKKAQKTYYLNKGQFFGELQIADIAEGKVIIDYKGEKVELYL